MQTTASQLFTEFKESGIISQIRGPDRKLSGITSLKKGGAEDLVFISTKQYVAEAKKRKFGAIVTDENTANELGKEKSLTLLISPNVNLAQALLKQKYMDRDLLHTEWPRKHPSAIVHESVKIPESSTIGPLVVIGRDVKVGERVAILTGAVIEHDTVIGDDTVIHPRVFIGYNSVIGKQVIIHPGVVIGSEGFGFAQDNEKRNYRVPQTGRVVIGDRVVIGALSTIDRAGYDETRIEDGVVFDNLCHVGHNCQIGENSIFVAMCAIGGSTKIGKRTILSGQTGIVDHTNIPDDTVLLCRAGVLKSIEKAGVYAGLPLQPLQAYLRNAHIGTRLTELNKRLKNIEKILNGNSIAKKS